MNLNVLTYSDVAAADAKSTFIHILSYILSDFRCCRSILLVYTALAKSVYLWI